jgi:hypothetical protein
MYRNLNKSKFLAALSTEHTLDSFKFSKNKENTSLRTTSHKKHKSLDQSKEESANSLPHLKEKQVSKFQFKIKFTKNNQLDMNKKKIIKGRLMKLINNSSLEHHFEEEVKI